MGGFSLLGGAGYASVGGLGEYVGEQVLILDLNKRKVGFLALGHGPVVGME